jgi:hypothetical protein
MGVVLNCGVENLYISLQNWTDFKNRVLFETLQIIGGLHPNLFVFIDEKYEINKRRLIGEQIPDIEPIYDMVSLKNIREDKLGLIPEMYIEYVNQNWNDVNNLKLIGIHELFYNKILFSFNNCRNISIALLLLKTYITFSHAKTKIFNQVIDMFDYSWENKKDILIL